VNIKPPSAEIKSKWSYNSTPLHGMDRNDLTFTFYVILEVFEQRLEMLPNREFHENPFIGSQDFMCENGQT
jgi:hypothetical protein